MEARLVARGEPRVVVPRVEAHEELVEPLFGRSLAAHRFDQPRQVVGHHPEIVFIGRFAPVFAERFPRPVGIARLQPAGLGVVEVFPRAGVVEIAPAGEFVAAGVQRELPDGEVRRGVFELLRSVVVPLFEVLFQARALLHVLRFGTRHLGVPAHDLEQREGVVVLCAERPGVCDQDRRGVALHDAGLDVGHHPAGKGAARLLGEMLVREYHVGRHVGRQHREQLDLRAVGIPVAERGVLLRAASVHPEIGAHVLAVHVAAYVGVDQYAVEVRVELGRAVGVGAFGLDQPQVVVPPPFGGVLHGREIPPGVFGREVCAGVLHRDVRNADLVLYVAVLGEVEREVDARFAPLGETSAGGEPILFPDARCDGPRVELGDEVDLVRGAYAAEAAAFGVALAAVGAGDDDGGLFDRRGGDARADDHGAERLPRGVFIAGHARALGDGELRLDRLLHGGFVVAGMALFAADADPVVEDVFGRRVEFPRYGEGREITHVAAPAAAQLVDDEPAPLGEIGRRELYHAERVGRPGVEVTRGQPHAPGADQRVDLVRVAVALLPAGAAGPE